ncbi:O-antigen ligase family protein [[Clostridium] aminophilum]|uniref:O-antigen ligase family protein n=1 Tax=[Clostridium] aminophilum TaxID=1526 RepID=UPI003F9B4854
MRIKNGFFIKDLRLTPLVISTFLAGFAFLLKDYNLSITGSLSVFAVFALLFAIRNGIALSKTKIAALFLAVSITSMALMPWAKFEIRLFATIIAADVSILYVIVSRPDQNDVRVSMKILASLALTLSVYAIAIGVYPNFYYNFISRLLPQSTRELIERGFRYHYGIYVGRESFVVSYFAFFGIVISLNTLMISGQRAKGRIRHIMMVLVCIIAIVMQNRKAELLMTAIVVLILFFSNVNKTSLNKKVKRLIAFALIVIVFLAFGSYLLENGYLSRYETFFALLQNGGGSRSVDISTGRFIIWARAWKLFKNNPIIGIGWGNFSLYMTDYYNSVTGVQVANVHNDYLQLLCETGIVGFLCFTLPMLYILSRTLKCIRQQNKTNSGNDLCKIALSTSFATQLFFLMLCFIDPVWYKLFAWLFYGVAVNFLVYAETEKQSIVSRGSIMYELG